MSERWTGRTRNRVWGLLSLTALLCLAVSGLGTRFALSTGFAPVNEQQEESIGHAECRLLSFRRTRLHRPPAAYAFRGTLMPVALQRSCDAASPLLPKLCLIGAGIRQLC